MMSNSNNDMSFYHCVGNMLPVLSYVNAASHVTPTDLCSVDMGRHSFMMEDG